MAYKINKIILQNFKVFNKDIEIDSFYTQNISQNLQILTGQNGYGKSSTFDAIELVLTGDIKRLYNVSGRHNKFKDNLITNNMDEDVIVGLELFDSNKNKFLSILKYISKENIKLEKEENLREWFETYIYEDKFVLENLLNKANKQETHKTEQIIKQYLEINPKYFYINYIQQQDPISFLKKKEEDRKDVIGELLKTDSLKDEKYSQIENKIKLYEDKYEELKSQIILDKTSIKNDIDNNLPQKPEYKRLFLDKDIDWDLCKDKITNNSYEEDLNSIKNLLKNYNNYECIKRIDKLNKCSEDYDMNNKIAYYLKYIKNLSNLESIRNQYLVLNEINNHIKKNNWIELNKVEYIKYVNKEVVNEIQEEIKHIESLKEKSNNILLDINKYRKNLIQSFNKNNLKDTLNEAICPLCGNDYKEKIKLEEAIKNYTNIIENLLGDIEKDVEIREKKIRDKKENVKTDIEQKIISIKIDEIEDQNYKVIKNNLRDIKEIEARISKLKEMGVDLLYNYKTFENEELDINSINKNICEQIRVEILKINTEDFNDLYLEKSQIDRVFDKYFNNSKEKLKLVNLIDIEEKLNYLNYCYKYYLIEKNNKKYEQVSKLKENMIKIKFKLEKFKNMKNEYDSFIDKYKSNIICKIEIPLYIYTGKILQNHPTGLGIFCNLGANKGNKITRLKFIGNMKTSHDIINIFSSGQLAGFVIGFTLAMKKVYNNNLDVILIDDPVQTMDELNLISFTEILRNEFCDKQVIMSTHEYNIAGYIDYKYRKYKLDSSILDVRERFN